MEDSEKKIEELLECAKYCVDTGGYKSPIQHFVVLAAKNRSKEAYTNNRRQFDGCFFFLWWILFIVGFSSWEQEQARNEDRKEKTLFSSLLIRGG